MELSELIHARRSVRAYQDRPVEAEKVKTLLDLVDRAPSAGNLQAYEIYRVSAPRVRAALARAADQSFIAQAPLILVFFANPGRSARKYGTRGKELYALQDATIAATYAMLVAQDLGLSTVWIGAFDDAGVTAAVSAPGDWVPIAVLPIGYAAEKPDASSRRNLAELVHDLD
ncbi:MAG: Oxygen-insensitive NADPH nitroreductase [Chloroflexi bacterium ADurb.Bin325]|nr:MAG: Oxygen-insensitive NADPH nitroreductase [Chloroflexi bacterium ADurb.Bin325]